MSTRRPAGSPSARTPSNGARSRSTGVEPRPPGDDAARHAYPVLGDRQLAEILPSDVQAWVKRLELGTIERKALAPATIGVVHSIVAGVFKAAVRDRRIVANPCDCTKLPKTQARTVVPPTTEQVEALAEAMPPGLQAVVTFAAGTGVRQGEVFGLTVDRLDMLRREVHLDRQLVGLEGPQPLFGPPKTSASVRTIPCCTRCGLLRIVADP
jgi:integrase